MVKDFTYNSPYIYCPACGIPIPKDEVNTQHIYTCPNCGAILPVGITSLSSTNTTQG